MSFFQRIRFKLVLGFILVGLIPAVIIGFYSLQFSTRALLEQQYAAQDNQLISDQMVVENFLEITQNDVKFLSDSIPMQQFLDRSLDNAEHERARVSVEQEFLAFAQSRGIYYQIRFLNALGDEVVRVDTARKTSRIINQNKLQNKGDRYYFKDAIVLDAGKSFVSPLDLNREKGKVEVPHKPVIRYAVSVLDSNGKKSGIIIVNVNAKGFLNALDQDLLVDDKGYYLAHPITDKRWGSQRDLGTGASLNQDFPKHAAAILTDKDGKIDVAGYLLTHRRVDIPGSDQHWTLLALTSTDELMQEVNEFRVTWGMVLGGSMLVAIILGLIFGGRLTQPLEYLTEAATAVSTGNLIHPIKVNAGGEIGELAEAFERMRLSVIKMMERRRKKPRKDS